MDFFINHSGFFLGIFVVILLAIIGYYADKKDNEKKISEKKDFSDNLDNVASEDTGLVSFDELPSVSNNVGEVVGNSDSINDLSLSSSVSGNLDVSNFSENNLGNDVLVGSSNNDISSDVNIANSSSEFVSNNGISNVSVQSGDVGVSANDISFNSTDFESLDFSLEDLEKKNFDDIAQSQETRDDENYYYSYMEDGNAPIGGSESNDSVVSDAAPISQSINVADSIISDDSIQQGSEKIDDSLDNHNFPYTEINADVNDNSTDDSSITEFSNDVGQNAVDNNIQSSVIPEMNDSLQSDDIADINNKVDDKPDAFFEDDLKQDSDEHLFDNETQLNSNLEDSLNFSNTIGDQQVIPELFDSNRFNEELDNNSTDNSLNFNEDSSGDDIWKF